jgi:hypothetical protein
VYAIAGTAARQLRRPRLLGTVGVGVLLLLSVALPHVAILGQGHGRWLLPTASFFATVQPAYLPSDSLPALALALNVTYVGLGLQQLSQVAGVLTFWILASDDINRWLFRILLVCGWMMALSVPFVITGWSMMVAAGTPAVLGLAWLPTLLTGFGIIVGCRLSRSNIDGSWFLAKPELQ